MDRKPYSDSVKQVVLVQVEARNREPPHPMAAEDLPCSFGFSFLAKTALLHTHCLIVHKSNWLTTSFPGALVA